MKSLVINGRFLSQRMTGVHRYAYEMTCALKQIGVDFIVVAPRQILTSYDIVFPLEQTGKTNSHYWEQIELTRYVRRHYKGATILSFTGLGPILYNDNICTIHDMSFLANPGWFTAAYYWFYRLFTPVIARRARKIITVSQFSKQEIIQRLQIPAEKIIVAYNAVSNSIVGERQNDKEKYLLAVSSLDPRKNLNRLVEAYRSLGNIGCKLYIVGAAHPSFRKGGIPENNDENIIFKGYVGGSDLANLYANALAAVYPSLYEGFGLPNVEAMANHCPVVTSAIAPHHEVCADAALYFDPYDTNSIANTLKTIIRDSNLRDKLREAGIVRLKQFSWEKSAQVIYNNIR